MKEIYSLNELARLSGTTRARMQAVLEAAGVPCRQVRAGGPNARGTARYYTLADLAKAWPESVARLESKAKR